MRRTLLILCFSLLVINCSCRINAWNTPSLSLDNIFYPFSTVVNKYRTIHHQHYGSITWVNIGWCYKVVLETPGWEKAKNKISFPKNWKAKFSLLVEKSWLCFKSSKNYQSLQLEWDCKHAPPSLWTIYFLLSWI